jgi:hypothetical protein
MFLAGVEPAATTSASCEAITGSSFLPGETMYLTDTADLALAKEAGPQFHPDDE